MLRVCLLSIPPQFTESSLIRDVGRTIGAASYTSKNAMTDEACIAYCSSLGYIYAGTEYSSQCCEFALLVYPLDFPDRTQIVATPWQQDRVQPRQRAATWPVLEMRRRHAVAQTG